MVLVEVGNAGAQGAPPNIASFAVGSRLDEQSKTSTVMHQF